MEWILYLIIGGIIGWLASMIMKTDAQMGAIANVLVGVLGSMVGGWLGRTLQVGGGAIVGYLFAILGAVILIAILKMLGVFK